MRNIVRCEALSVRRRINCLIILFLCLLSFSCTKKQIVKSIEKPLEKTITVETLRDSIVFKEIKTLKSEVTVRAFKGEEITGRFNGVFVYMEPDSVNIRLFGPMGLNMTEVTITKGLFQVYIPYRNILFESRGIGTTWSFNNLLEVDFIYSLEEAEDKYILYVFKPHGNVAEIISKYAFKKHTLLNTSISFYDRGKQFMEIAFEDFSERIPRTMKIFFYHGFGMEITMKNPSLNTEIPEDYFKPISHNGKNVKPIQDLFLNLTPNQ